MTKNNYERKEDEINGHIQDDGWHPVMALLTMSWWLLPLCCATAPHICPASSCLQWWWGVLSSLLTLVGPPLPVITCTHQPSSLQAVAHSGGVWYCGCCHLPLVPVIILFCISSAGAGAIGAVIVVICSHPSPPPSCPFLLSIVMEMVTGPLAPVPRHSCHYFAKQYSNKNMCSMHTMV
jgi:hypothetical protein